MVCHFIREKAFGNVEPANNIISNKAGHSSSTGSIESDCLDPLGIALCNSKDLYNSTVRTWILLPWSWYARHIRAKNMESAFIVGQ